MKTRITQYSNYLNLNANVLGGTSALVPVLDFILYYVYIFISLFFSVSPCDSIACLNGGTCVVDSGFAICFCRGDYTGSTCSGKTQITICTHLTWRWCRDITS
jgi:hypothetical protein